MMQDGGTKRSVKDIRMKFGHHGKMRIGTALMQRGEKMAKPPYDDYCYECGGYGDDYYVNDDGELVCRCLECPYFEEEDDD